MKIRGSSKRNPAGAHQWTPSNQEDIDMAPDAEDSNMKVPLLMTTADMAMIRDPEYRRFQSTSMKIRCIC